MSEALTSDERDSIHNLFMDAIGKSHEPDGRYIIFRAWQFDHKSHWGDAVAAIVEEGVPQSKKAVQSLDDVSSALRLARRKLLMLKDEFPDVYAGIEDFSTAPVNRSHERLAVNQPVTAKPPHDEVTLIFAGVELEKRIINSRISGKHPIYSELVDFWCCVTGLPRAPSDDSRMVRMIGIACRTDAETVGRYLRRNLPLDKKS